MSGVSRISIEPSLTEGGRMKRAACPHVTFGLAVTALISATSGLMPPATAQTFGSAYTSTILLRPSPCPGASATIRLVRSFPTITSNWLAALTATGCGNVCRI